MTEQNHLRFALDSAKTCVHTGQAHKAMEYLHSIRLEIEDMAGNALWAEHALIYAGALAAQNDPGAEYAFQEAIERCTALSEPNQYLLMTAHADFAKYLAGRRAPIKAREHYREAEKLAERLGLEECGASFTLCLIRLDLETRKDPQLTAFQRLREAAKDGYTAIQQRDAWVDYVSQFEGISPQLEAARKAGSSSVDFFRGILTTTRKPK